MRWIRAAIVALLLPPLAGCTASQEKVEALTQELIGVMLESASVMEPIKDVPTAKAAEPKLAAIFDKMKGIKSRDVKTTERTQKAVMDKYRTQLQEAFHKMHFQIARIQSIRGAEDVGRQAMGMLEWFQAEGRGGS